MIIVYLSIVLVVGSLIYLAISAVKIFKDTKPVMNRITKTTAMIQAKTEQVKTETDKLALTQKEITSDVQFKKDAIQQTINNVKQTPKAFMDIWHTFKEKKNVKRLSSGRRAGSTL
ncbi:DUF948 domain-containing protein [Peribacillus glennii]|uniref:DUF948 domain-containing protein n=1 Tax=Peribacillus glennii TaxID=2303991 RepID=A0A372LEV5_9BACI|nr:DUF948 domain-containing protein [Peribacillus glennii]RFU63830.1 DUF948 domain-containing protein [Peribacillus glennii]